MRILMCFLGIPSCTCTRKLKVFRFFAEADHEVKKAGEKMEQHKKKMVAPVVATVVIVLYYLLYFGLVVGFLPGVWKLVVGILPLAAAGGMIAVCIQRINEIKGGEEDDISNY